MKVFRNFLCLLLALLMTFGALSLVACGNDTPDKPDDGKIDDPGTTDRPDTPDTPDTPDVPDTPDEPVDPDEENYAILSEHFDFSGSDDIVLAMNGIKYVDDPDNVNDGDAVEAAEYRRQYEIEDLLKITYYKANLTSDTYNVIPTSVQAGTHEYDIVGVHMKFGAQIALTNNLRNIRKFPHIDLEKPWWNQSMNKAFTYKTLQYWTTGDITTGYINGLFGMFADTTLFEQYTGKTPKDLFDEIFDGKWTLEKVIEYTNGVYEDRNNNDVRDEGDLIGWYFTDFYTHYTALCESMGYNFTEPSGSKYKLTLVTPENEFIFEKVKNFVHGGNVLEANSNTTQFMNENCMFSHNLLDHLYTLRSREADFSIIPLPKLAETDNYRTPCYDGTEVVGVVGTEPLGRYDLIGAFTEVFAAMGRKYVTEALFETTLKSKYARNEGSYKCLDIIRANGYCDFAYCWTALLDSIDYFAGEAAQLNKASLAVQAAEMRRNVEKMLDNLYMTLGRLEKEDKARPD